MKPLKLYFLISFGLAWVLMAAGMGLAQANPLFYQGLVALAMYAPLLAVLASCRGLGTAKTGICWKPRFRGNWGRYALALLGPCLLTLAGAALYFLLYPAKLDLGMSVLAGQMGMETVPPAMIAAQIALSVTLYPLINMLFALGEEVGWRGYLTPQLQIRLGRRGGLVAAGVIWGVWHWPLILLAGYEYGVGYPGAPFTGALAMCLFTTAIGILLSWLYEKSGSIWVPALGHGAINAIAALPLYFLTDGGVSGYLLGPTLAGVISVLPALALALFSLRTSKRQERTV
ncbi:MAG: lysostaphin resistance A-like protein [Candidatus Onthomonas sp.]